MTSKANDHVKEVGVPYWLAVICSLQKTKLIVACEQAQRERKRGRKERRKGKDYKKKHLY